MRVQTSAGGCAPSPFGLTPREYFRKDEVTPWKGEAR